MLTYEELHEALYSSLEYAAVEAAYTRCKIEEASTICNQAFYGLRPAIQRMKMEYHRESIKKYRTLFRAKKGKQRKLDKGAKGAFNWVVL